MMSLLTYFATAARLRGGSQSNASTLYFNATIIRTMDQAPGKSVADAFCVRGSRFAHVGTLADVKNACKGAKTVDFMGASVVPGLIDSHAHLLYMGFKLARPQFDNCTSVSGADNSVLSVLKKFLKDNKPPAGKWIQGFGWDQNRWASKEFPTKEQLDAIVPNNPVFLTRVDGHAGWANSLAIKTVPPLPASVEGGKIYRDTKGQPTGIFGDNAMHLIENYIPPPTQAENDHALRLVLDDCARNGLTAIHNPGIDIDQANLFKRTIDAGNMTLRQYAMWLGVDSDLGVAATPATPMIDQYGDGLLDVKAVKFFMDGALGSWGAAMIEPYTDHPERQGYLRMSEQEYHRNVTMWHKAGYQIATHAIGDLANRIVIDSYRSICTSNNTKTAVPDLRLRIEHFQIVNVSDIERIHFEAGPGKGSCILPSMQPTHAVGDMSFAETRIGSERLKGAYAWEKVLETGVDALPFGSDFPTVGTVPPLLGLYAATTREDLDAMPVGGWTPSQRVSSEQALKGYTIDAAFAGFQEKHLGSITAGKYADFVALDKDIVTEDAADIWKATVVGTFIGGKEVFRHECFDGHDCPLVDPRTRIQWGGDGCPHGNTGRSHSHSHSHGRKHKHIQARKL